MIEQMPTGQTSREMTEREADEFLEMWLNTHPEPVVESKSLAECDPEAQELAEMINRFEADYSLDELNAITDISGDLAELFNNADDLADQTRIDNVVALYRDLNPPYVDVYLAKIEKLRGIILSPEEARILEIRGKARKDSVVLYDKSKTLVKTIRASYPVEAGMIEERVKKITNAVGTINFGRVVHDR